MQTVTAALGPEGTTMDAKLEFDTSDAILCDAMRCLLAHTWVMPLLRKGDAQMLLTLQSEASQLLSLYSSQERFAAFSDVIGDHDVTTIPRSLSEVVAGDLTRMTKEACKAQGQPEANAVRGLIVDPHPSEETGLFLTDSCFPLLQTFQKQWVLGLKVIAIVQKANEQGPAAVTAAEWRELFTGEEPLVALVLADSGMFAMESGLPFFCYPGDAVKVRQHQQEKALHAAKVTPVNVATALETMRWRASRGGNVQIIATAVQVGSALQCHGLTITPEVFKDHVAPALTPE
eukprot:TRINITY_DN34468_c0_g1_i3.p1 TRINITY_DN34468_c0_g1~~TRINITY_DN34468_c0_g1_i3.p1  ORF type:complete len:289 (+),score=70.20 TRINITY_DN34468_c0_g1_i3:74-940(+)